MKTKFTISGKSNKIKRDLDSLISSVEAIKEDFDLQKILSLLGDKLFELDISALMFILGEKAENLHLRHISISKALSESSYNYPEKMVGTKVPREALDYYARVLEKKQSIFVLSRQNSLLKKLPQLGAYLKDTKFNSVISPIIIRNRSIGVIEFFSPSLKPDNLDIIDMFSRNLIKNIANIILFQAIRESEERYRKLVDNANEIVLVINNQELITFANSAFYKITGYTKKDLAKGLYYHKLIHPEDASASRERFEKRLKGDLTEDNFECRALTKSGETKWISFSGVPIYKQDQVVGIQTIIRDITDNKTLEEKYRQSKEHYEQVIDAIQDGICVIDRSFKIVSYNKAFAEKTGYRLKDLKGKHYKEALNKYDNSDFNNFCCFKCSSDCMVDQTFASGRSATHFKKTRRPDGSEHYYEVDLFPKQDTKGRTYEVVITIKDITQEKRASQEIKRLSAFSQRILNNSPISILVLDKKGRIILANDMAISLIGNPKQEIIGTNLPEYKEISQDQDLVQQYRKLLKSGKSFYYDSFFYVSSASQKKKYLNIFGVPLYDENKKLEGAISMALDNTEAVKAKEKLKNLNKHLEKKVLERTLRLHEINKQLEQAVVLKSKFISDASHELRTPLTVIQGNLDLSLREAEINGCEAPESYELILSEVDRMTRILSDLTMLTNIDANSEQFLHEEVNLGNIVTACCRSLSVLADQKKIALIYKKGIKNFSIYGDEAKLEKLLLNIVRNAIKYTNEKGRIRVDISKAGEFARIAIQDSGIGIPEADLPFIFERFYRVDKARSRQEGGTGLGLAISKWIAEAHGGKITVESKVDQGTTFSIFLPLKDNKKKED